MERITLWGWIEFEGKDAAPIVRGASHLIAPTYAEQGCVHYVWTADPVQAHRVWVFEEWERVEDLQAHLEGPLYREMAGYLAEAGMTGAQVDKYRVDRKQPVYDGAGVPKAAFD